MCDCEGKVALVTGASRGIGQAIALQLGKQGATVIGTATTEAGAEKISAAFAEAKVPGRGMVLNVTDPQTIDHVFKELQAEYEGPDILINNAAITRDALFIRMKEEQWDDIIDTNLNSIFRVTRLAVKGMLKKRWGRVVSVSSVVSMMGNVGQTNYGAAKAGVEGFSRSLAREVAKYGITVNVVAPGFVETDMSKTIPEKQQEWLLSMVPVGRLAKPEEIAAAVGFLVAPEAAYVTGITMPINGGMLMA